MTEKEFNTIIANSNLAEDVKAKARDNLEKIAKKNSARAEKPTKTQIANEPIAKEILEILSADNPMLSTDVALALGVSTQKANGILGNLLKEGKVLKVDVKVPKKGTQKGWYLPTEEDTDEEPSDSDIPIDEIAYPPITV